METSIKIRNPEVTDTELSKRKSNAIVPCFGMMTQVYADRAGNAEIWKVEGIRRIDFATSIAFVNTGHRDLKVIDAVMAQLDRFSQTFHRVAS